MPILLSALPCIGLVNSTSQRALRSIAHTASAAKALPFSLHRTSLGSDHEAKVLRMVMFGKPGSGKGTLSSRLVKKYDVMSLSTGDLLRQHIAERTAVGRQAESIVAQGGLVPDEIMLQVVTIKLDGLRNRVVRGFSETEVDVQFDQSHYRAQNTPLSLVINLDVADEVILSRISDRWVHLPSGRVYNMSYNRPKVDGFDDETGEPLTKRPDDNPEIFARRLKQFHESTSPLTGKTSDEIWPKLEAVRAAARRQHSLGDTFMTGEEAWSTKV
ncbi:ADK-domain-containing protein [Pisolithus orientalis]|uniref:ADK-domain-containing protein n=1 Tax=Pisolithus orientalis TaxID=936130 RepID=UPI002223FB4B|nr:ADK-domain-containing protein [Pisolithus orientalis]KAI6028728.1 ADK-domain-containing protein [Pisolithus orientalis]